MATLNKNSPLPPYAVVIGLDCVTGLQTARILYSRGVPVIGVAADPEHCCCRTNACQRILYADDGSGELIDVLKTLGAGLTQRAVLFPCTDNSVLALSRHRQRIEDYYHVVLPAPEIVELLANKVRFYDYAQREGIPIPSTFVARCRSDAERVAGEVNFPCILKPPLRTPLWLQHGQAKVYRVETPDELLARYDQSSQSSEELIVQEWIDGGDWDLYSCYGFFGIDSEPIATFVARKLRQWPPHIGTSCLGVECRNDRVRDEAIRLFKKVGYYGFGYVEVKRERRTGEYFIIEPNIGRPGLRSAIAEAGGVDLLYTQYCYALGWPLPQNLEQTYGNAKWIYWLRDVQSAFYYMRRGELTLREWWQSWKGRKVSAVFSWSDPLPFLGDCLRIVPKVRKKTRRTFLRPTEPPVPMERESNSAKSL